jgi:hypothetical protein
MTLRRLAVLQWVGLVLGGVAWFAAHIVGWGITEASCDSAGFDIHHDLWQALAMAAAGALVIGAMAAAVAVLYGTRGTTYEEEPPLSRVRFLAIAAAAANLIFLMIILLDAVGSILNIACRQA